MGVLTHTYVYFNVYTYMVTYIRILLTYLGVSYTYFDEQMKWDIVAKNMHV